MQCGRISLTYIKYIPIGKMATVKMFEIKDIFGDDDIKYRGMNSAKKGWGLRHEFNRHSQQGQGGGPRD